MSVKVGEKRYLIKLWSADYSTEESSFVDARVSSYSSVLNSGLGQFSFQLERTIQNWNDAGDIDLNKVIELWVSDIDTGGEFIRVYAGYVSRINFIETYTSRTVTVVCLGFVSRLTKDVLKSSAQSTLHSHATDGVSTTSPAASTDPSVMFKGIVDHARSSANGNIPFINYRTLPTTSVELTGITTQNVFRQKTYFEALNEVLALCPTDWFWKLDADSVLHLSGKPAEPTHTFGLGALERLEVSYSMEEIVNGALVWDRDTTYRYIEDANSVASYGRRVERKTITSAEDSNALDKAAYAIVGENKDPRSIVRFVVSDNNELENLGNVLGAGYDIESIKVGQTCNMSGIRSSAGEVLSGNMLIRRVEIEPTRAFVEVDAKQKDVVDIISQIKKEKDDENSITIPDSYTAV